MTVAEHALRAGPLDLLLHGCDVRYLRLGDRELVRRVYAAVRDPDWSTIPGEVEALTVEEDGSAFTARMQVRHTSPDVDVRWVGEVVGTAAGVVTLTFDAEALADTSYNRIGFCFLHPVAGFQGRPFRALTPDGEVSGTLPDLVGPQRFVDGHYVPLFPSFSGLDVEPDGGPAVTIRFEGDLFETEDQRNWTDASLKSYCTPLALGFPHHLAAGERLHQRITISAAVDAAPVARRPTPGAASHVSLTIADEAAGAMPAIGVGLGDPAVALAAAEEVRALGLAHARADIRLDHAEWRAALDAALAAAQSLGLALELALHVGDVAPLGAVAEALGGHRIARVMAFRADAATATESETTSPALAGALRAALGGLGCPLVAGTDMAFCELNRTRPPLDGVDQIAYPIVAQTHAFDDRSIVETLEVQPDTVRTARAFAGGRPIVVSPVTLRARFNQHATRAENQAVPDDADPRLHAPFGTAWTVGSVAALAGAGASALTYFEAAGRRGIAGRPLGVQLGRLAALAGGEVFRCTVDDALAVAALAVGAGPARRVVLANLGATAREVALGDVTVALGPYEVAWREG